MLNISKLYQLTPSTRKKNANPQNVPLQCWSCFNQSLLGGGLTLKDRQHLSQKTLIRWHSINNVLNLKHVAAHLFTQHKAYRWQYCCHYVYFVCLFCFVHFFSLPSSLLLVSTDRAHFICALNLLQPPYSHPQVPSSSRGMSQPTHPLQQLQLFHCLPASPGDFSPHSCPAKLTLLRPQALRMLTESNKPLLHEVFTVHHTSQNR